MSSYSRLVSKIINFGQETDDRTGIGTISIFGEMIEHDFSLGFPAETQKKLFWKPLIGELLWFIEGSTNVERLRELTWGKDSDRKTIWDENYESQGKALGYTNGNLGPVYGHQWRSFGGVDQLKNVIDEIKNNPNSRRLLVSAWNPVDLDKMTLPPCHYAFQFKVRGEYLDIMWSQRSVDTLLGLPFNIASYATLLEIVAKMTGYKPGMIKGSLGDCHIYNNHIDGAKEMLSRSKFGYPVLDFPDFTSQDTEEQLKEAVSWGVDAYKLVGYNSHPPIKLPMAV